MGLEQECAQMVTPEMAQLVQNLVEAGLVDPKSAAQPVLGTDTARGPLVVQTLVELGLADPYFRGRESEALRVIRLCLGEYQADWRNPNRVVGRRLQFYRYTLRGWTQEMLRQRANEKLAFISDMEISDKASISRIESGEYKLGYVQGLAITQALGIPADALSPWASPRFI